MEYILVWALTDFNATPPKKYETESQCIEIRRQLEQNTQYIGMTQCIPSNTQKIADGVFAI